MKHGRRVDFLELFCGLTIAAMYVGLSECPAWFRIAMCAVGLAAMIKAFFT